MTIDALSFEPVANGMSDQPWLSDAVLAWMIAVAGFVLILSVLVIVAERRR